MASSIVHRMTGLALTAGTVILAWWLAALAAGPDQYRLFCGLAATPLGQLVLFVVLWSISFHILSGFRHLVWDIGFGFAKKTSNGVSVVIILLSIVLAVGIFALGYLKHHGGTP